MALAHVTGTLTFEFGLDDEGTLVWEVVGQDVEREQAYPAVRLYAKKLERELVDAMEALDEYDDDDPE